MYISLQETLAMWSAANFHNTLLVNLVTYIVLSGDDLTKDPKLLINEALNYVEARIDNIKKTNPDFVFNPARLI